MADALVALENHPGRKFLHDAQLTGQSLRRWESAKQAIGTLWDQFEAYRRVLADAQQLRERSARPNNTDLAELTRLLTGSVVDVSTEEVPLERRGLTGAGTITKRVSLRELVDGMRASFAEVAELVADGERVWSAYVGWLDTMQQRLDTARSLSDSLGPGAQAVALRRIGDELAELRAQVFADPLALVDTVPNGTGDPSSPRVRRIADELAAASRELDELARVREGIEDRLDRLRAALDEVADAVDEANQARATAQVKIVAPDLPAVGDPVPALRQRLEVLRQSREQGSWSRVSELLDGLERAVADAGVAARSARENATALLDRRAELRGRLDAYSAKAGRLSRMEDPEISALYQTAHRLLWTAPCDLGAATRAVVAYQRALGQKGANR